MAFVLKIAIASAVLAAAFVYGSEQGSRTERVSVRGSAESAASDVREGIRIIPLAAREPA